MPRAAAHVRRRRVNAVGTVTHSVFTQPRTHPVPAVSVAARSISRELLLLPLLLGSLLPLPPRVLVHLHALHLLRRYPYLLSIRLLH